MRNDIGKEEPPRSGALRPPGELGHAISPSESDVSKGRETKDKNSDAHPAVLKARQEELAAIERNHRARHCSPPPTPVGECSLVTALCYCGMQVVVGTSRNGCYVICPQTHFLYQTLSLTSSAEVISLVSCDETGLIVLAHSDGQLQTYLPEKSDSNYDNSGPCRWWNAASYDCKSLFSADNFRGTLDISLSHNYKILLAHDDQLAVLSIHSSVNNARVNIMAGDYEAEILWTTQLPGKVEIARISGNSHSIAVVLQKNSEDDGTGSDGVHTLERDWNDGSYLQSDTSLSEGQTRRAPLIRASSVGTIYKPGPFLLHGAPVTRMSFRGLGHLSVHSLLDTNGEQNGNDLLLTHCDRDSVARIFAQHNWKELVDWTTLGNARVDWIRGIASFTLGDLGSSRPKSSLKGGAMPRTTSEDDIYETLGKGRPTQSMPNHAQPYSGAGAWVSEISFQGALATIRLSRLAYLQRGIDDAYPTLFEYASSFLPPNTLFSHGILDTTNYGFCIQAIWPAWNPWLSDTVKRPDNTETLRGSAMSFLGLPSGSNAVGGHFGDSLLGITESPPLELRMTCTHPMSGSIILLGFRLRGDRTAIDIELPRRAVLSLRDLEFYHCRSATISDTESRRPQSSRQHESGRLTARVSKSLQSIDILWRRPGTGSFLPSTWLPDDADHLGAALANANIFHDESLLSVPIVESLFHLPDDLKRDTILEVLWWTTREPKYGGPSFLVTITTSGSIVVFSVPPPSAFLETSMSSQDEWFPSDNIEEGNRSTFPLISRNESYNRCEYEVLITPDPDHGLGLRLESKIDGSCAVAGSFKKHPLNGEMLPAERTGIISLGDELISTNGISLENQPFEDIIVRVRECGASAGGNPICLKFRPLQQIIRSSSNASNETYGPRSIDQLGPNELNPATSSFGSSFANIEGARNSSTMIAFLRDALTAENYRTESERRFELVPMFQWFGSLDKAENGALIVAVDGASIRVFSLFLADNFDVDGATFNEIGHFTISQDGENCGVQSLSTFRTTLDGVVLAVWDVLGRLSILHVCLKQERDHQLSVSFKLFEGTQLSDPTSVVRGFSSTLFATMSNSDRSDRRSLLVHSCVPHPGLKGDQGEFSSDFTSKEIVLDPGPSGDRIVDFCFLSSGHLDSAPSLVVFSYAGVTLYKMCPRSMEWIADVKVFYNGTRDSNGRNSLTDATLYESLQEFHNFDAFPHLMSDLFSVSQCRDEEDLLFSDWSPESLLAYICSESKGAKHALQWHVRNVIHWIHSDWKNTVGDFLNRPLPCAPIEVCKREAPSLSDKADSIKNSSFELQRQSGSDDMLELFLKDIQSYLDEQRKMHLMGENFDSKTASSKSAAVPSFLRSCTSFDVQLFLSLGQLALAPPDFQEIDSCGELFLFAASLFQKLDKCGDSNQLPKSLSRNTGRVAVQHSNSHIFANCHVASCACLAAMISADQELLLERCRPSGEKLDWDTTRKLRIPFWLRSDVSLAKVCEEIGQTSFRKDRDIMECAIFFIACGKLRTLRNLAATDQTETGRKFFNFLTSHDFESTRGRLAAEKNAFSLLRKNKYSAAAAFFLLSKPPSLKSAVETILTKLHDIDLAFLVMRLMTNTEIFTNSGSTVLAPVGGFGAGGGFIATTDQKENQVPHFNKWSPRLCTALKNFLIDRLLPMTTEDNAMASIILFWLNEKSIAAWILSGTVGIAFGKQGGHSLYRKDTSDVSRDWITEDSTCSYLPRNVDPVSKSNQIIDIVSKPIILARIQSPEKPLFAAFLSTFSILLSKGHELPALQSLLFFSGCMQEQRMFTEENLETSCITAGFHKIPGESIGTQDPSSLAAMNSSIFDDFDGPPKPEKQQNHFAPGAMESSIFDDFAGPPKPSLPGAMRHNHSTSSGAMESSIFDDFAGPPKVVKQQHPSASGAMESSIFDDFAGPPKTVKQQQHTPASGAMESSIFDDFAGPPKVVKQQHPSASDAMESSIFDDFAGPPKTVKQQQHTPASGAMESSIFDDFAGPPKTVKQESTSTSGAIESSIVSDFAGPLKPIKQQNPSAYGDGGSEIELELRLSIESSPPPQIWSELMSEYLCIGAARRVLREIARIFVQCQGDPPESTIDIFYTLDSLVPPSVSNVLQLPCDGESIVMKTKEILAEISSWSCIEADCIVQRALQIIGTTNCNRLLFEVVLHSVSGRMDLAEFAVRTAARGLIHKCSSLVPSTDATRLRTRSRFHSSSQFLRRQSARVSWQLESCLWLHRGDSLPLSGLAMKESICAVRLGLLIASWNRNFGCMEALVQIPPDCPLDENTGRLLWTSVCSKDPENHNVQQKGGTSGGWEFLVDCKRSQATEMLKDKPTGCFIIRPHTKDHGVFTLSFKTNLVPAGDATSNEEPGEQNPETFGDEVSDQDANKLSTVQGTRSVKKNDVVQHAIIRLSDSGFRCGSFGPFASLMSLLEAVSASLPFKLRFDKPPANHLIQDEGSQTSPNAVLFRKLALSKTDSNISNAPNRKANAPNSVQTSVDSREAQCNETSLDKANIFASFLNLMTLLSLCRQLSSVVAVESVDPKLQAYAESERYRENNACQEYQLLEAHRIIGPFLSWCRTAEILVMSNFTWHQLSMLNSTGSSIAETARESAQEIGERDQALNGDEMLRKLIQQGSGVEFSTLRLVDGGECTMVVLFKRNDALKWLVSNGHEQSEAEAASRLAAMESARYIEPVDLSRLKLKPKGAATQEGIAYRFIDPWEVEALESRDAETQAATLGRNKVLGFTLGKVAHASEPILRSIGGDPLLELWTSLHGGILLTKAIASLYPPWERAAGGDLISRTEPSQYTSPYLNSIRKSLYRNSIFRELCLPQRFVTLIQVELLDLKNLTSPGGSLSLTVYALLRPKRAGHGGNLTNKARTLDSAGTQPVKLTKSTGPNAPASWGSVVRFRFCLPEDVSVDGTSRESDQENIFKGPPTFLQLSVYEKKLLADHLLGSADISMDGLWPGGQLEEWVPLRSDRSSITWFARIRLTLRFELMCLAEKGSAEPDSAAPSVGLRRIEELSRAGGAAHEESFEKRSLSSPDLLSYFESMVY